MKESEDILKKISADLLSVKQITHLADIFNTSLKAALSYCEGAIFSLDCHDNMLYNLIQMPNPFRESPFFLQHVLLKSLSTDEVLLTEGNEDFAEFRIRDGLQTWRFGKYLSSIPPVGSAIVVFPMRQGNDFIGNLFLLFTDASSLGDYDIKMLMLISVSINLVLIDVLAREKVLLSDNLFQERLHERMAQLEALALLGNAIASVRSFEKLLEIIDRYTIKFIGFRNTMFVTLNDNHPADKLVSEMHFVNGDAMARNKIDDGFVDRMLPGEGPVIYNIEELAKTSPLPGYMKAVSDAGIVKVAMVRFSDAKDAPGVWLLAFDHNRPLSPNAMQMVKDVAKMITSATQNVFTSLEYERRELEKNRLIQFSNSIASIRNKANLARTVKDHLHDLFEIDDFLLWSLSEDHSFRFPVLFDDESIFASHPAFKARTTEFRNHDGIYNVILAGTGVSYFDACDLEKAYSEHPYFAEVIETSDIRAMGGSVLRIGEEVIGLLTFSSHRIQLVKEREELYLSICSQLAIVASNMLATDKISAQLAEISKLKERLEDEKIYLQEELKTSANNSDMIGSSQGIKTIHKLVEQVAYTDSTVLILGETGTGKELVARSVHNNSPRKSKLMVKVNCAALPATLIESELFGHEKGSFTGASERRLGKFELANHGTLFLDEIGELPLDLQGKLLRAIQEKEIERVGGKAVIKVDVRVIAATNRNLEKEVASGKFRSDLYYRINIFPIRIPPLRDRISDIPLLASHFISKYAAKVGKEIRSMNTSTLRELQRYNWPGNIRELEHTIERSVLLTKGDTLKTFDIPVANSDRNDESMYLEKKIKTIDENEREHIVRILKMCHGRVNGHNGAAILLGIPPSTLNSKMKRLDIRKREMRP
ncbi:Transcriptional regulator containing GAF, AAA-type ATPase, and DNA-binding Fis domains [Dyadobacter soli]|uniref:Transcriptional regulator containing GAF, AAA-type ATPase, and DNA-binding Fis domains n=1 Tax=Dyadobacter soli TaxID=659014 RepID=A0A1G7MEM9_9BACT|nr:sigma 54-interacting transcriptional regulator [Dyadobacter soli]SDF60126.1 Transcriptional regulator containing GAF, AAA-type ATPase, and DNA-binding Fis domains [Dyadobacter soli]